MGCRCLLPLSIILFIVFYNQEKILDNDPYVFRYYIMFLCLLWSVFISFLFYTNTYTGSIYEYNKVLYDAGCKWGGSKVDDLGNVSCRDWCPNKQ